MQKLSSLLFLFIIAITFSCKKDDTKLNAYSSEITNITDNIIVATYNDLDAQANLLLNAVNAFKIDSTNTAKLVIARDAWRNTRAPWEASEGFLFGPVSTQEIDPNIDTWPVDANQLDSVLLNNAIVLNKTYIDGLTDESGTGLKGFHVIEFLLFGIDGTKTTFTSRELQYLVACTESLKSKTAELKEAWSVSGGNFANQLKSRGSIYPTEKSVLVELAEGIRGIAGEVYSEKIAKTLDALDLEGVSGAIKKEESNFSNNTKNDFTNNIISIQNVYLGKYGNNGNSKGLSNIVVAKNVTLDAKIKTQILEAIAAIKVIGGSENITYSDALANNRSSIETAQTKIETLETTLRTELLPLISGL